jgi:hypothetical protein
MAGAALLFLLGYQWGNQVQRRHAELPAISGVLVRPPGLMPPFSLRDPMGRVFDQETLAAGWTLVSFGDLSRAEGQLAIQHLVDLYNRVSDQEDLHRALKLVLVTTTDAPNLARDYARLSPALFVLSGEPAEVDRLRAGLGMGGGMSGEPASPLFVFAPGGYLIALFPGTGERAPMAADLRALHDHLDLLLPEGT